MSKGSLHESLNHLIDATDQRMITQDELLIERHHISKAINAVSDSSLPKKNGQGRRRSEPCPNDSPTGVEVDLT
jgi:hypothetical protein